MDSIPKFMMEDILHRSKIFYLIKLTIYEIGGDFHQYESANYVYLINTSSGTARAKRKRTEGNFGFEVYFQRHTVVVLGVTYETYRVDTVEFFDNDKGFTINWEWDPLGGFFITDYSGFEFTLGNCPRMQSIPYLLGYGVEDAISDPTATFTGSYEMYQCCPRFGLEPSCNVIPNNPVNSPICCGPVALNRRCLITDCNFVDQSVSGSLTTFTNLPANEGAAPLLFDGWVHREYFGTYVGTRVLRPCLNSGSTYTDWTWRAQSTIFRIRNEWESAPNDYQGFGWNVTMGSVYHATGTCQHNGVACGIVSGISMGVVMSDLILDSTTTFGLDSDSRFWFDAPGVFSNEREIFGGDGSKIPGNVIGLATFSHQVNG